MSHNPQYEVERNKIRQNITEEIMRGDHPSWFKWAVKLIKKFK